MRHYEIREEVNGRFTFECTAIPHETTPWGWIDSFRLVELSETEARKAEAFARSNEATPMHGLYERTEAHLGRVVA